MKRVAGSFTFALVAAAAVSLSPAFVFAQSGRQGGQGGQGGQQPDGGNQEPRQRGGGGGFGGGGGPGGFGGRAMEPSVTSKEMDQYAQMLGLNKSQKEAVDLLFDAYQQDFNTAAKDMRDRMEKLREEARDSGDAAGWQAFGDEMTKFRNKRQEMETAFFSDIKATLSPQQQEKWPAVERLRRRERTLNRGLMSGERVDVVKLVDDLKLTPEQMKAVTPVLEQYQVELDRELIPRNQLFDQGQNRFREMFQGGDMTEIQKNWDQARAASIKVRDVNSKFARQVEQLLPEDKQPEFAQAVRRESFPQIYRPSNATRLLDAAAAMTDLDASQKQAITTLKESFTREYSALSKQMEQAYSTREAAITPADVMGRFGGGGGGGGPRGGGGFGMVDSQELTDLRDKRRDLESQTADKVRSLLTEEQAAKLPSRDRGGDNGDQPRRRDNQTPRRNNNQNNPPANQRT